VIAAENRRSSRRPRSWPQCAQVAHLGLNNHYPSGEEKPPPFSVGRKMSARRSAECDSPESASPVPLRPARRGTEAEDRCSSLPYETEEEIHEAVANFKAYLDILREWDERERGHQERPNADD